MSNIHQAVEFYRRLFHTEPAKRRPETWPRPAAGPWELRDQCRQLTCGARAMVTQEVDVVFLIADLAGYTALTEAHGNLHDADAVTRYAARVGAARQPGARLVERVGDEVLVIAEVEAATPARAATDVGGSKRKYRRKASQPVATLSERAESRSTPRRPSPQRTPPCVRR